MRLRPLLPLLAVLLAPPLAAQLRPQPGSGDPRIQTVDYEADQVVQLQGMPGYQMTVELGADEQIENVAVGNSGAWQVTANRRGDHLFVKAIQADVSTNMTVVTNVRLYAFELVPFFGPAADMPYMVRFRYPSPTAAAEEAGSDLGEGRYRVTGDRALRPSAISDDGRNTYIQWPRDRALPAVYAVDPAGRESLVNGNMRDDVFVIDDVVSRLVFRIDRRTAEAARIEPRGSR